MVFLNSFIENFRVFILLLSVVYTVYNLIKTSTIVIRKKNNFTHTHNFLNTEKEKNKGKMREAVVMSSLFQRVSAT